MLSTRRINQAKRMGREDAHDDFFHVKPWNQVCTEYSNLLGAGASVVRDTMLSLEDEHAFAELYAQEYQAEVARLTRVQQATALIHEQALQRFPASAEEPTTHEQELWCRIFTDLTGELLALRRLEDPAALDEEGWEVIAFGCLSPMASALLKEAEAEEQAALAREASEIEARLAQREAEQRRLKTRQEVWIWVNQGRRPATVLAVVGQQALLEYVMPKGSTSLRLVDADDPEALIRTVGYRRVPLPFLRELVETGVEWIGEPQAGHPVGSPAVCLRQRPQPPSFDGQTWQTLPQRPQKLLFALEDLAGGTPILSGGSQETFDMSALAQEEITLDEITQAALSEEQGDEHASV